MIRYLLTCAFVSSLLATADAGRTLVTWEGDVRRVEEYGQREKGRRFDHHRRGIKPILNKPVDPARAVAPAVALYNHAESPAAGGTQPSGFARWLGKMLRCPYLANE